MRKRNIVTIPGPDGSPDKEFTVKELTVQEIIDLSGQSTFLGNKPLKGKSSSEEQEKQTGEQPFDDLALLTQDLNNVMKVACDFNLADLKKLTPSEIRLLYDAFNEVNQDFLDILKELGISDLLNGIRDAVLSNFSKQLVTSLKAAM